MASPATELLQAKQAYAQQAALVKSLQASLARIPKTAAHAPQRANVETSLRQAQQRLQQLAWVVQQKARGAEQAYRKPSPFRPGGEATSFRPGNIQPRKQPAPLPGETNAAYIQRVKGLKQVRSNALATVRKGMRSSQPAAQATLNTYAAQGGLFHRRPAPMPGFSPAAPQMMEALWSAEEGFDTEPLLIPDAAEGNPGRPPDVPSGIRSEADVRADVAVTTEGETSPWLWGLLALGLLGGGLWYYRKQQEEGGGNPPPPPDEGNLS